MSTLAVGAHPPRVRITPRPRLRITPRGRAVLAALVIAPVAVVAWLGLGFGAGGAQATNAQATNAGASATYTYVSVVPGQSLWQLAEQVAPQADPREVVADILSLNNLSSGDVQPGQELAIPAEYLP